MHEQNEALHDLNIFPFFLLPLAVWNLNEMQLHVRFYLYNLDLSVSAEGKYIS